MLGLHHGGRGASVLIVVVTVVAALLSGCDNGDERAGHEGARPSEQVDPDPAAAKLLSALGADRVVVMVGDDPLRAGLGVLDEGGLRPLPVEPRAPLMSNLAGNGDDVIIGAADVREGTYTDGVYLLRGHRLDEVGAPDQGLFGPTMSSDGVVAAVQSEGGFSVLGADGWHRDPRLAKVPLSAIAWGNDGTGYTVVRANRRTAAVMTLPPNGAPRILAEARCASQVLAAPTMPLLALSGSSAPSARCREVPSSVLEVGGVRRPIPAGWSPVAWAADSRTLLVSRENEIALWSLDRGDLGTRVAVPAHVWMAAPVHAEGAAPR